MIAYSLGWFAISMRGLSLTALIVLLVMLVPPPVAYGQQNSLSDFLEVLPKLKGILESKPSEIGANQQQPSTSGQPPQWQYPDEDADDRRYFLRALVFALENTESGTQTTWKNPSNSHYGIVIPAPAFRTSDGQLCRRFERTRVIGTAMMTYEGTACREAFGSWSVRGERQVSGSSLAGTPRPPKRSATTGTTGLKTQIPPDFGTGQAEKPAARRIQVAAVQRYLNQLGYNAGSVDGILGPKTRSAIRVFQRDAGLPIDGKVSKRLLAQLEDAAEVIARSPGTYSEQVSEGSAISTRTDVGGAGPITSPPRTAEPVVAVEAGPQAESALKRWKRSSKEILIEALDDFAFAIARKIDADIETIARAYWSAQGLEDLNDRNTEREQNIQDLRLARLSAIERGTEVILAAKNPREMAEALDNAESPVAFSSMLAYVASVTEMSWEPLATRNPPLRIARARTMLEVSAMYAAEQDYIVAATMYLLGFRDLDSPVGLPDGIGSSAQRATRWLWGAESIKSRLVQEIEDVVRDIAGRNLDPEAAIEPIIERIRDSTNRVRQSKKGNVVLALAASSTSTTLSSSPGFLLGAIGGLGRVAQEARKFARQDVELIQNSELTTRQLDGLQYLAWTLSFRTRDGRDLGVVDRQVITRVALPVPKLSKRYTVKARFLLTDIAHAMLASLPLELANLAWLVDDRATFVRFATGGSPRPEKVARVLVDSASGTRIASEPRQADEQMSVAGAQTTGQEVPGGRSSAAGNAVARVGLKDGSVVTARLVQGELTYKTTFGQIKITISDVASLADGRVNLKDGTRLKGEIVGGEIMIETRFGRHSISVKEIVSIDLVEAAELVDAGGG